MNAQQRLGATTVAGVTFSHPGAFWFGAIAVTLGVIAHLPMYLMAKDMGYRLAGMPMDTPMILGMAAIIVGIAASFYGLYPRSTAANPGTASQVRIKALDDAPITRTHVGLLVVMALGITIDVMKPTTIAFVLPGMTHEYGLESSLNPTGSVPVAYFPLVAIMGTVLGSLLWGWLGDLIGRRASILFSGIIFIATSICGAMPSFVWNMVMCFIMGVGVGGMLPIAHALMAETIPARHRSWLMVLIGSDVAGAYILTSWLAAELIPLYGWRIMWLIGAPTGVLFILLNRWIPESARFLLAKGREAEARAVMARYGAVIVEEANSEPDIDASARNQWGQLMSPEILRLTLVVGCLAIGSGLVLFGFNLWIPSNLRVLGFTEADAMLRNAALIGFPLTFLVAWMYGFWSAKKTVLLLATVTAAALFGFVLAGNEIVQSRGVLYALLVVPIWGINSLVAVLSVYSSEIYPTRIRARGTGFAAGASKAGGVLIIALVAFGIAVPSITAVALMGAIPLMMAVLATALFGIETRRRRLEEITADALQGLPS
ncbi:MAG: MFS transporter [Betaproteobacteria bacterium]|nr:MFS transporter [Betaproteobacteria bacterium]